MPKYSQPFYLLFVVFTIILGTFQYGYHTGELNMPQELISKCQLRNGLSVSSNINDSTHFLPRCLPMTESEYSMVVSMLLVGGLVGACSASYFSDRYGRRPTLMYSNGVLLVGSVLMAVASSVTVLMVGRVFVGVGGGVSSVVVPAYVSECVPKGRRGFFGTFNQLAIVGGVLLSQIAGSLMSSSWRSILLLGGVLAVVSVVLLPMCVESPVFLVSTEKMDDGGRSKAKQALCRLRGGVPLHQVENELDDLANHQKLPSDNNDSPSNKNNNMISLHQFLVSPQYRHPLMLILLIHIAQQFSGINAVIFYSASIMSSVFPDSSDRITLSISFVNLLMTVISASLMDRAGRRTLFLLSSSTMACSSIMLGWSLQEGYDRMAALAILLFVASFALGLGPIPFLMIPELVERSAATSAGSVGLAANMLANFMISAGFMALRDILGQARVFYLFAWFLVFSSLLTLFYLPETKNKSPEQIVRSRWAPPPLPFWLNHQRQQQPVHQYDLVPTSVIHQR